MPAALKPALRPSGAGAVMAAHAPANVAADDARKALSRRLEYFPTPPWAARAGGELIAALDPMAGLSTCWEPACGQGHMAHGLADYFERVDASDIHDHGAACQSRTLDFLSAPADRLACDWIVTNPPFSHAAAFVRAGMARARRGVAILARTALLESAGRYPLFFPGRSAGSPDGAPDPLAIFAGRSAGGLRPSDPLATWPLTAIAPFFERVPMTLGGWDPGASTATAYAWFVWMHPAARADASRLSRWPISPDPVVLPIPPGTRARLTRPRDARDWGARADAPLLEGLGDG